MKRTLTAALALFALGSLLVFVPSVAGSRNTDPTTGNSRETEDHILQIDTPDKGYLHFPVRILNRSTYEALTFDPRREEPATISYHLTRDGHVRIRVVRRDDPRLIVRTLLDWTLQEFGDHRVTWDGRDASGNLVDNTKCRITFEGDDPLHRGHDPLECREPALTILTPATADCIHDLAEIRVRLARATAQGRTNGYDLRCWVDYELVFETTLAPLVEVFTLRPTPLEPGPHLVTINVDDGAGHVGTAGLRIRCPGDERAGEQVFREKRCADCHSLDHQRWAGDAPGLRSIGSRRPATYLQDVLRDPKSVNRTSRKTSWHLTDVEQAHVLAYLTSLRLPPAASRTGRGIYLEEGCADCHDGANETGAMLGPYLDCDIVRRRSRAYLREVILAPQRRFPRTAMPPTRLTEVELERLIDGLRDGTAVGPPGDRRG